MVAVAEPGEREVAGLPLPDRPVEVANRVGERLAVSIGNGLAGKAALRPPDADRSRPLVAPGQGAVAKRQLHGHVVAMTRRHLRERDGHLDAVLEPAEQRGVVLVLDLSRYRRIACEPGLVQ